MPIAEPAGAYRPRHPDYAVVNRPFDEHCEWKVGKYDERQEDREGSPRRVAPTAVEAYLACRRLKGGFAQSASKEMERRRLALAHRPDPIASGVALHGLRSTCPSLATIRAPRPPGR